MSTQSPPDQKALDAPPPQQPDQAPPTLDEARAGVVSPSPEPPKPLIDSKHNAESERVEIEGRRQFFELRGRWSKWIIGWISFQLLFQFLLTFYIGSEKLNFSAYSYFLPIVTIQTFLQIVGMGFIVVKFLYPNIPEK